MACRVRNSRSSMWLFNAILKLYQVGKKEVICLAVTVEQRSESKLLNNKLFSKFETLNSIAKKSLCNKVFISRVKAMVAKARAWRSSLNTYSKTWNLNKIFSIQITNWTKLALNDSQFWKTQTQGNSNASFKMQELVLALVTK